MQKPKRRSLNRGNKLPWLAGLAAPAAFLHALPNGGEVKAGSADITASAASDLLISQQSDRAVIHWSDFDIDKGETVTFRQPSRDAWVLNRDTSGAASNILGDLSANGGVFLLNPHGILVGDGARLDVGSLVMTTADIESEDDFMKGGNIRFSLGANAHQSRLLNQGEIRTQEGGFIGLIGARVENQGKIAAAGGVVQIASSKSFYVDFTGDSLIGFETSSASPISGAGIEQTEDGSVEAGTVIMTAHTAQNIMDRVINLDGVVRARKLSGNGGRVVLNAGEGHAEVQGSVDAGADSGPGRPSTPGGASEGGQLDIFGAGIILAGGSKLRADGERRAGTIRVGGDYRGNTAKLPDSRSQVTLGPIQNAEKVIVQSGALIHNRASLSLEKPPAVPSSDGQHSAIFWADEGLGFYGTVDASGGVSGGFVEISGQDGMELGDDITVNAASVLFDPFRVTWQAGSSDLGDNEKNIRFDSHTFADLTINQAFWSQFVGGAGKLRNVTVEARNRILITGNINPLVDRTFNLSLLVSAYGGVPAGAIADPGVIFKDATLGASSNNKIKSLYISTGKTEVGNYKDPFVSFSGGSIYVSENISVFAGGSVILNSVRIDSGGNISLRPTGSMLFNSAHISAEQGVVASIFPNAGGSSDINITLATIVSEKSDVEITAAGGSGDFVLAGSTFSAQSGSIIIGGQGHNLQMKGAPKETSTVFQGFSTFSCATIAGAFDIRAGGGTGCLANTANAPFRAIISNYSAVNTQTSSIFLTDAIPNVLNAKDDINFVFGGEGAAVDPLFRRVKASSKEGDISVVGSFSGDPDKAKYSWFSGDSTITASAGNIDININKIPLNIEFGRAFSSSIVQITTSVRVARRITVLQLAGNIVTWKWITQGGNSSIFASFSYAQTRFIEADGGTLAPVLKAAQNISMGHGAKADQVFHLTGGSISAGGNFFIGNNRVGGGNILKWDSIQVNAGGNLDFGGHYIEFFENENIVTLSAGNIIRGIAGYAAAGVAVPSGSFTLSIKGLQSLDMGAGRYGMGAQGNGYVGSGLGDSLIFTWHNATVHVKMDGIVNNNRITMDGLKISAASTISLSSDIDHQHTFRNGLELTADQLITLTGIHATASEINLEAPTLSIQDVTLQSDDSLLIGLKSQTLEKDSISFGENITIFALNDLTLTDDQFIISDENLDLRIGGNLTVSGDMISIIGVKEAKISAVNASLSGSEITLGNSDTDLKEGLFSLYVSETIQITGSEISLYGRMSMKVEAEQYTINAASGWIIHSGQSVSIDVGQFSVVAPGAAEDANNGVSFNAESVRINAAPRGDIVGSNASITIGPNLLVGAKNMLGLYADKMKLFGASISAARLTVGVYDDDVVADNIDLRNAHLSIKEAATISARQLSLNGLSLSQHYLGNFRVVRNAHRDARDVNRYWDVIPNYNENVSVKIHAVERVDLRWVDIALAGTLDISTGGEVLMGADGALQSADSVVTNLDVETIFFRQPRIGWANSVGTPFDGNFGNKPRAEIEETLGGFYPGAARPIYEGTLFQGYPHASLYIYNTPEWRGRYREYVKNILFVPSRGHVPPAQMFTFSMRAAGGLTIYDRPDVYQSIAGQSDIGAMVEAAEFYLQVPHITHSIVQRGFRGTDNNFTYMQIGGDGPYDFDIQPFARVHSLNLSGGGHIRADVWADTLNLLGEGNGSGLTIAPLDGYGSIGVIKGTATRLTVESYQYDAEKGENRHFPIGEAPRHWGAGGEGKITLGEEGTPLVLKHPVRDNGVGGKVTTPYRLVVLGREVLIQNVVGQTAAGAERVLDSGERVVEFGQASIFGHVLFLEHEKALSRLHSVTLIASSLVESLLDPEASDAAGQGFAPQRDDASSRKRNVIDNVGSLYIQAPSISIAGPVNANTVRAYAIQGSDYTILPIVQLFDGRVRRHYGTITQYTDSAIWHFDYPSDLPTSLRYTFGPDGPDGVEVPEPGDVFTLPLTNGGHSLLPLLNGHSLVEGQIGMRQDDNHQPFAISLRPAESWGFFTFGPVFFGRSGSENPIGNSMKWLGVVGNSIHLEGDLIRLADGFVEEHLGLFGKTIDHLPGFSLRQGNHLFMSMDVSGTLSLRVHASTPVAGPETSFNNLINIRGGVSGLMDLSLSNAEIFVEPDLSVSVDPNRTTLTRVWTHITTASNQKDWYWDWRNSVVPYAVTKKLGPALWAESANITLHGSNIGWHGGLSVDKALGIDFDGTMRNRVYIESFRGNDGVMSRQWVTQSITVNTVDLQFGEDAGLNTLMLSGRVGEGLTVELTTSHYTAAAMHPLTGFLVSSGGDGLLVLDHLFNHLSITGVNQGNFFVDGGRHYHSDFYTLVGERSLYLDNLEATLSVMRALTAAALTNPLLFLGIGSFNSNLQLFDSSVVINLGVYGEIITVDLSHLDNSLYLGWRKDNDPFYTAPYFKRDGIFLSWDSLEQWGNQSVFLRGVLDSFRKTDLTVSVQMDTRESGLDVNARAFNATFASLSSADDSPGPLVLGDIKGVIGGRYTLMNGQILQKPGTSIDVSGGFGVAAPGVTLTHPGNRFGRLSVDQLSYAEMPRASVGLTVRAEGGFDLYAGGDVDLLGGKPYANNITVVAERMLRPDPALPPVATHLNPDGTPMRVRLMGARNNVSLTVTAGAFEVNGRIHGNLTARAPGVGELGNLTISALLGGEGKVNIIDAWALQGGVTVSSLAGALQSYALLPGFFLTLPGHISIRSGGGIVGNARITAHGSLDLNAFGSIYLTNLANTLSGAVFASAMGSIDLRARRITIGNLMAGQGAHLSAVGDVVGLERMVYDSEGGQQRVPMMVHVNEGLTVTARNLVWDGFTRRHISLECDPVRRFVCEIHQQDTPFDPNSPIRIPPSDTVDFVLAVPGQVALFADAETDFNIRAPSAEYIGLLGFGGRSVYISLPGGGPPGCAPPRCALMLDRVSVANLTIELDNRDLAQVSIAGAVSQTLSSRLPFDSQKPAPDGLYYSLIPGVGMVSSALPFPDYLPRADGYYYTVVPHALVTQTHAVKFQIDLLDFMDVRYTLSSIFPFANQRPDADGYYHTVAPSDIQVSSREAFPAYIPDDEGYYYSVLESGVRVSSKEAFNGYERYDDGYYYSIKVKKGDRLSSKQPFPAHLPESDGYYYTVLPDSALPATLRPLVIDREVQVVVTETVHHRPTFSAGTVRLIGNGNNMTLGNIGNSLGTLLLDDWKHASVWAMSDMFVSIDDVQTLNLRAYLPAGDYIDGVHERAITETVEFFEALPIPRVVQSVDLGTSELIFIEAVNFCDYLNCEYHKPLNGGGTVSMLMFIGEPFIRHKHVTRGLGFSSRSDSDLPGNITLVGTAGLKQLNIDGVGSGQVTVSYSNSLNLGRAYAGGLSLFVGSNISGAGNISLGSGGLYLSSSGEAVFRGDGDRVAQTLVAIAGRIGTLVAEDVRAGVLMESRGDQPAIHGLSIGDLSAAHARIDLHSGQMSIGGLLQAGASLQLTATDAIVGGSIRSNEAPVALYANHIDLEWLSGTAAEYDDESHGLANFTLSGIGRLRPGSPSGITIRAIDAGKVNLVSVSAPGLGVSLNFGSARQPNLLIYAAGRASISAGPALNLMGAIVDGDLHAHVVGSITYLPVTDADGGVVSPGSISIGGELHVGGQVVRLDHGSVAMDSLVLYSRSDGPSSSITVANADDLELYFVDYQIRRGDGKPGGFAELTVHADGNLLLVEGSAAIHGSAHLSATGNVSELYTSISRFLYFVSTNAAGEVVTVSKNGNRAEVEVTGSSMTQLVGTRPVFTTVANAKVSLIDGLLRYVGGETVTAMANGDFVSITVTGTTVFGSADLPTPGADGKWTIKHVALNRLFIVPNLDGPTTLYPNASFTQVLIPGPVETFKPTSPGSGDDTELQLQKFTLSYIFSQSFNLASDRRVKSALGGLATVYHSVGLGDDLRNLTLPHIPGDAGLGPYDFLFRRWTIRLPGRAPIPMVLNDGDLDKPNFADHFPLTLAGPGYTEVFHLRPSSAGAADQNQLVMDISYQFSREFNLIPSSSVSILNGGEQTVLRNVGIPGNFRDITVPRSEEHYIPVMKSADEDVKVQMMRYNRFGVHLANFTISGSATMTVEEPNLDHIKLSYGNEIKTVLLNGGVFAANFPLTLHSDRGSKEVISLSIVRDRGTGEVTHLLQVDYLLYPRIHLSSNQITVLPDGATTVFNSVGVFGNRRNITLVREGVFAQTRYADGVNLTVGGTLRIDAGGNLSQRPNEDLGRHSIFSGPGYTLTEAGPIGRFLITGSYTQQQPTLTFRRVEFAPNQFSLKYNTGYEIVGDQEDQVIANVAGRRVQMAIGASNEVALGIDSKLKVVPVLSRQESTGETVLVLSVSYDLVELVNMNGVRVSALDRGRRLVKNVGVAGVEVRDITLPEEPSRLRPSGGMTVESLVARAGGDMHLYQLGNAFGWASVEAGGSIHLLDEASDLTLGGVSADHFTLSAFGVGDVHGSGPVTAAVADLSVPNGSVGLTAANHISSLILLAQHGTVVNGPGPDELAIDISVRGDMTLSAAQRVTQADALTVGRMLSIRAVDSDERQDIVLDRSGNRLVTFAGVGAKVTLVDSTDGIELKDRLQADSLSIRQIHGNVNAPGVLEIGEDLEISAPQGNIQLPNKSNQFNTLVSLTASGNVVLYERDGFTLGGNIVAGSGRVVLGVGAGGIYGVGHSVWAGSQDVIISARGDVSIDRLTAQQGDVFFTVWGDASFSLISAGHAGYPDSGRVSASVYGDLTVEGAVDLENELKIYARDDLRIATVSQRGSIGVAHISAGGDASIGTLTVVSQGAQLSVGGDFSIMHIEANGNIRINGEQNGSISLLHARGTNAVIIPGIFTSYLGNTIQIFVRGDLSADTVRNQERDASLNGDRMNILVGGSLWFSQLLGNGDMFLSVAGDMQGDHARVSFAWLHATVGGTASVKTLDAETSLTVSVGRDILGRRWIGREGDVALSAPGTISLTDNLTGVQAGGNLLLSAGYGLYDPVATVMENGDIITVRLDPDGDVRVSMTHGSVFDTVDAGRVTVRAGGDVSLVPMSDGSTFTISRGELSTVIAGTTIVYSRQDGSLTFTRIYNQTVTLESDFVSVLPGAARTVVDVGVRGHKVTVVRAGIGIAGRAEAGQTLELIAAGSIMGGQVQAGSRLGVTANGDIAFSSAFNVNDGDIHLSANGGSISIFEAGTPTDGAHRFIATAHADITIQSLAAGQLGATLSAGDDITIQSLTVGERGATLSAGDNITIQSLTVGDGGATLSAGDDITVQKFTVGEHGAELSAGGDITIQSLTVGEHGATLSAGGSFKILTASMNRLEAAGVSGAVYEYGDILTLGDLTVGDFTLIMTSTLSGAASGDVRQDTAAAGATVGSFSFQGGNLNLTHSANSLDTVHLIDLPGPVVTSSTSIEIGQLTVTNTGALVLVPLPGGAVTLSLPAGENMQVVNGTSYVLNTIGSYVYVTTHLAAKTINIIDSDDLFIDASYLANHVPDGTLEIGGIHLMGGGHLTLQASEGYVHGRSITAGSFTLDAARADLYGALAGHSTGEAADHLFVNAARYVGPYRFNGKPGWQGRQTSLDHQDIADWWQEGARFANDALETGHEIGELAEARYAARTGRPYAGWFFGGTQLDNFVVVRLSRPLINLLGLSEEDEQPILLFSQDEDEDE